MTHERREPMVPGRVLHVEHGGRQCLPGLVTTVTPDELTVKVVGWHGTSGSTLRWTRDDPSTATVIDYGPPFDTVRASWHWPLRCEYKWPEW